jgi:hypothetical protein
MEAIGAWKSSFNETRTTASFLDEPGIHGDLRQREERVKNAAVPVNGDSLLMRFA